MTASKEIIVKALDELSEDRIVKVLDPIRCLLSPAIGKVLAVTFSVLLPLSLIALTALAQGPDHVVISEIQAYGDSANDDWIELYNPTNQPIDLAMGNYRIERAMTALDPSIVMRIGNGADGTYPGGTTIPAHGFYLIVRDDASETLKDKADAIGTRSEFTWTGTGYTLYLGNDAISSDTDPDIVDKVGSGTATYYESSPAPAIPDGKSIERKAQSTSTAETMGPGGVDEFRGNGYDSDDNSFDLVLRTTSQPQNLSSPQEPGPPMTVTITAAPTTIPADGSSISIITATVVDTYTNPVADGTVVTFTTNLGSFPSAPYTNTTTSGVATATLTSGTVAGTATITATANSKYDTTTVEFTPGPPFTVTVTAYPTSIPADGTSTSTVTATVVDQYSNDVADSTVVTFTTDLGSFPSAPYTNTTTSGVATATLTSQTVAETATITATSDSAFATTTVEFTPGPPRPVGGAMFIAATPMSKLRLLAPWLVGLGALMMLAASAGWLWWRRKA